jgi:hypothetical protein
MKVSHSKLQKGYYDHPLYQVWERMLRRCCDPNCSDYPSYGAKGITVCDRWFSIENFISDMDCRPTGYTLERKDNKNGYSPENCIWASKATQARNRRTTKLTLIDIENIRVLRSVNKYTYSHIGSIYNVDQSTIYAIFKGKSWRKDG